MPKFAYSARTLSGEIQTGEIELPSRDEVMGWLNRQRLRPISVNAKARDIEINIGTGIKTREVVIFTRQFATMITAIFVVMRVLTTYVIPEIPQGFQILMGISNAVYFGSKVAQPGANTAVANAAPPPPDDPNAKT